MERKTTLRVRGSIARGFAIFCFFVRIQVTVGILIEQPDNTAALLSVTITLKCKSNEAGKLTWNTFGKNSPNVTLWNGYSLNSAACPCSCCEIDDQEPGRSNLKITAMKETAKNYMCIQHTSPQIASASLIVIESALNCTINEASNDVTTLVCAIGFYGEWIPSISWSRSDGGPVNEATVSVENERVTSTLTTILAIYKDTTPPLTLCINYTTPNVTLYTNYTTPTMPLYTNYATPTVTPTFCKVYYTASVYFKETDRPKEVTAKNVPTSAAVWKSPFFKTEGIGVEDTEDPPGGSGAVVAAAVVGAIVVVTAAGIGVYALYRRQSRKTKKDPEDEENRLKLRESKPI